MKVVHESIHQAYAMIERKIIQMKTALQIPDSNFGKHATGLVLTGEHKGKLVIYLTYDQIEIKDFSNNILLVPNQHILCQVEAEEHEDVTDPFKLPKKTEPWLNLEKN